MSFDVQWENICNDFALSEHLQEFLNAKLAVVDLPHYLSNLQVVGFKFGDKAPEITIRDINIPFDEFYDALNEEEGEDNEVGTEKLKTPIPQPVESSMKNVYSIPLTPRREGSPFGLPLPSPTTSGPGTSSNSTHLFTKNPFLMPRNNSGMVQMRQFGVGLTNFSVAGGVGTPGVIENVENTRNYAINGGGGLEPNYNSSGMSRLESESDYFQHNESYNDILDNKADAIVNNNTNNIESGSEMDVQFSVDIDWDSHIYIEITCDLLVNYPALEFIRLPVRLKITDVKIHSLLIVAYIAKRVFISFLCDIDDDDKKGDDDADEDDDDDDDDDQNTENIRRNEREGVVEGDSDISAFINGVSELNIDSRQNSKSRVRNFRERKKGKDRIDIIQDMNIEGEIGSGADINGEIWSEQIAMDTDGNGLILRNIGKIENFLLGTLRSLLIDELGWPDWIELDFNESEEEELDNNEETKTEPDVETEIETETETTTDKAMDREQVLVSDGEIDAGKGVGTQRRGSRRESRQRRERTMRPDSYGDSESVYSHESYFTSGTETTGTDSDDD